MATRFYLPSAGTASVAPPRDASWSNYSTPAVLKMVTAKSSTALVAVSKSFNGIASAVAMRRYLSDPLNAQTISGTVRSVVRAQSGGGSTFYPNMSVRVVSRDGLTVRGTLLAVTANPAATALSTSALMNRKFPPAYTGGGGAMTSVATSVGDRIEVWYGFSGQGYPNVSLQFGDTGTDLVENETDTSAGSPWLEFSGNIVFEGGGTTSSAADAGVGPAAVTTGVVAPRQSVDWQFWLCDNNGVRITQISRIVQDMQITVGRNQPLTVTGRVPSNDPKVTKTHTDGAIMLQPGLRVLKCYRNEGGAASAGTYGGGTYGGGGYGTGSGVSSSPSWVLRAACHLETCEDHEDGFTGFAAYDPLYRLTRRLCRTADGVAGLTFDTTPAGDIVSLLVDNANFASETGVQTIGVAVPTLPNVSVTYEPGKTVGQAAIDLATASPGFDIYMAPIDHTDGKLARLTMFTPGQGSSRPDVILAYGTFPHTAVTIGRFEDASRLTNTVLGIGAGTTATAANTTSQTAYQWREEVASFTDVDDALFLATKATAALRPTPPVTVRGTPAAGKFPEPWTGFFLGDTIAVRAGTMVRGGFATTMTVEQFTVSITSNGYEQLSELAMKGA